MPTVKLHLYNSCTNAVKRTDTLSDRVQMQTWRRWSKPFTHSPLSKYRNVSALNRFTTSHAFSEWRWSHKMLSERVNDKYYYILHQWIHINWIPQLSNPLFSSKKRNRFKHLETKHLYERCSPPSNLPRPPPFTGNISVLGQGLWKQDFMSGNRVARSQGCDRVLPAGEIVSYQSS